MQTTIATCNHVHPQHGPCELTTAHHHCPECGFPLALNVATCAGLVRATATPICTYCGTTDSPSVPMDYHPGRGWCCARCRRTHSTS